MKTKLSSEIITDEFIKDAIINTDHEGFPLDYKVLHCLLKKYKLDIKRLLEIGTHKGTGTKIIKNALGENSTVYSMDLPSYLGHTSWNYSDDVGVYCDLPFIQLRSDSEKFNYPSIYPLDAFFIDANHTYESVLVESKEAIKAQAKLIIWHDTDINNVYRAIIDAFKGNVEYDLFRVSDTRIAYAVRKK